MNSDLRNFGLLSARRVVFAAAAVAALFATSPTRADGPGFMAQNRCAGLGGDFVAASGHRGCVRIGGHVRAETTHARATQTIFPPELTDNPITDGVRRASEAFHVRAVPPGGDIFPR